jgi:hypothetical protein
MVAAYPSQVAAGPSVDFAIVVDQLLDPVLKRIAELKPVPAEHFYAIMLKRVMRR